MDKSLTVRLIAPYGIIWEGKASFTTIPGQMGTFGVYPGHVPYVSMLGDGIAHIIGIDNSDMRFKTSGGFAFIRDDRVSILIEKTEEAIPLD